MTYPIRQPPDGDTVWGSDVRAAIAGVNTIHQLADAKGDTLAASGADTWAKVSVGANGTVLTADSTFASGVKWATPAASGSSSVILPSFTFNDSTAAAANTTALTSAISTAATSGKSVMVVGRGTVWLNASVTVTTGVRLIVDLGVTLKTNNPASGNALIVLQANAVLDGYGTIDGNRAAAPTSGSRGVQLDGSGAIVKDITLTQVAATSIYVSASADACAVVGTKILDVGQVGISVTTSGTTSAGDYTLIQGNRIERCGLGIGEAILTEGAGIKTVGDDATKLMGPEGLRIIGNHVLDAQGISIEVFGYGRAMTIADNHTRGGPWGISVDACQDVTVVGNTCIGHVTMGIEWANAQHGSCVGNMIDGRSTQSGGISITNPYTGGNQYLTVAHNVVRNIKTSTSGHSCINIQDASNLVIGPGNVFEAPSNGNGVRIQRMSTVDGGINMTTIKVQGNLIVGATAGYGLVVYNDGDNLTDVQQLIFENNTFKNCGDGLFFSGSVNAGAGGVANVYGSGNKFISVTTIRSGPVTGINDWQANYPRTTNN